jgi:hypothetical protein
MATGVLERSREDLDPQPETKPFMCAHGYRDVRFCPKHGRNGPIMDEHGWASDWFETMVRGKPNGTAPVQDLDAE